MIRSCGRKGSVTLIYQFMAVLPKKSMTKLSDNWDFGIRGVSDDN